ncbi:MAG: acetamidase/formamidase family protein [Rhizobiaceae bacterium]|nr:acetamidase/formamidase family protein [Rhizobiaceae bacterium]
MSSHRLDAAPDTVHWGYFSSELQPRLTIDSGDVVTISAVSGGPEILPGAPLIVPPVQQAIHQQVTTKMIPGHIMTGPVAVRGAQKGDVLQIDIEQIEPLTDWAYHLIKPLVGALPLDFEERRLIHLTLDADRQSWRLPWGQKVPYAPFFGVMGVAPPAGWGTIGSLPPRQNGGNIDNRELMAGSTLYLPVFADGALFSVGDGHGAQSDGEIGMACETGLVGTFRLTVRKDMSLEWPMAETATHMMTMASDVDLDNCVTTALRSMLDLVVSRTSLDRYQAYALMNLVAELRITQVANGDKGVHCMMNKTYLSAR